MRERLSGFTFQESKLTPDVWAIALALWLIVLAATVASICAQPFSKRQRIYLIALVVFAPILGLLAYLPFSIRRDELPTAFLIRGSSKEKNKKPRRGAPPKSSGV